jgi:phage FluMu protein Com
MPPPETTVAPPPPPPPETMEPAAPEETAAATPGPTSSPEPTSSPAPTSTPAPVRRTSVLNNLVSWVGTATPTATPVEEETSEMVLKRMRDHITEEILNTKCPKCKQVFFDYGKAWNNNNQKCFGISGFFEDRTLFRYVCLYVCIYISMHPCILFI